MPVCPSCDRLFLRNELFEGRYECAFPDCDGTVLGRTEYPVFGSSADASSPDGYSTSADAPSPDGYSTSAGDHATESGLTDAHPGGEPAEERAPTDD